MCMDLNLRSHVMAVFTLIHHFDEQGLREDTGVWQADFSVKNSVLVHEKTVLPVLSRIEEGVQLVAFR